jgi:protein phosphatase
MTAAGTAYAVQGNHDRKLERSRWLGGRKVTVAHGLQHTTDQLAGEDRRCCGKSSSAMRR